MYLKIILSTKKILKNCLKYIFNGSGYFNFDHFSSRNHNSSVLSKQIIQKKRLLKLFFD